MIFTALPIAAKAIFESDLNYKTSKITKAKEIYPFIYYVGQKNIIFSIWHYLLWLKSAVLQSLLVMYVCHITFVDHPVKREGMNSDMWSYSVTFFHAIIIIVNIRLIAFTRLINILNLVAILITSLAFFFIYGWISNYMWYSKTYMTF